MTDREKLWKEVDRLITEELGIPAYSIITVTHLELANNASEAQYEGMLRHRAVQRVREMMGQRFDPVKKKGAKS